jgi:hypothetical protein
MTDKITLNADLSLGAMALDALEELSMAHAKSQVTLLLGLDRAKINEIASELDYWRQQGKITQATFHIATNLRFTRRYAWLALLAALRQELETPDIAKALYKQSIAEHTKRNHGCDVRDIWEDYYRSLGIYRYCCLGSKSASVREIGASVLPQIQQAARIAISQLRQMGYDVDLMKDRENSDNWIALSFFNTSANEEKTFLCCNINSASEIVREAIDMLATPITC